MRVALSRRTPPLTVSIAKKSDKCRENGGAGRCQRCPAVPPCLSRIQYRRVLRPRRARSHQRSTAGWPINRMRGTEKLTSGDLLGTRGLGPFCWAVSTELRHPLFSDVAWLLNPLTDVPISTSPPRNLKERSRN